MKRSLSFVIALAALSAGFFATPALAQTAGVSHYSNNWSGYAAAGSNFSKVAGSWVVPAASNAQGTQADATWVGIGGMSSRDLIQAGTEAIVQNGQTTYQAWYELLPDDAVIIPLPVAPGDFVAVNLTEVSPNVWSLVFNNYTKNQVYTTELDYASSKSSVEWIEEMPSSNSSFVPLDNFGAVSFSAASAIENGVSGTPFNFGASPVTMLAGQTAIATPSPLSPDGASFSVSRTNTAVSASSSYVIIPRVGRGYRRSGQREGQAPSTLSGSSSSASTGSTTTITIPLPFVSGNSQQYLLIRRLLRQSLRGQRVVYTYTYSFYR